MLPPENIEKLGHDFWNDAIVDFWALGARQRKCRLILLDSGEGTMLSTAYTKARWNNSTLSQRTKKLSLNLSFALETRKNTVQQLESKYLSCCKVLQAK